MHLCFIGQMLGYNPGYVTTQGQIVADLFAADGYSVTCSSSRLNRASRLADMMYAVLKNHRSIDVVVIETFSGLSFVAADAVGLICKMLNLPLLMVLHGGNLPEFYKRNPGWVRRVLKRADRLVAPSEFLAKELGGAGFKVLVVPNVLDIDSYPFRERCSIAPQLIWMRSFHPIYNPEMAVRVLSKLKKSVPNARLIMAGPDKGSKAQTVQLAEELGLSDSIQFLGFLDHESKIREFGQSDIYINTNRIDNMPVSVLEARALGLPVVATNVGGLPHLIEHEADGLLVESDDPDDMASAIIRLIEDKSLVQRISKSGRQRAELSSWTAIKVKWEELFADLVEQRNEKQVAIATN
jgi:glycosyltransferase involved in cell wall biosynthesis